MDETPTRPRNVLGTPLGECSNQPLTGFYRDGSCVSGPDDHGVHSVCAVMSEDFLAFSQARGNDLSTPMPAFGFPGLQPGDRWCVCAARWLEAAQAGQAPPVLLEATHERTLDIIEFALLQKHAHHA